LKFAAVIFGDDVAGFVAGFNPPYYRRVTRLTHGWWRTDNS
jgi:hypothetical protein